MAAARRLWPLVLSLGFLVALTEPTAAAEPPGFEPDGKALRPVAFEPLLLGEIRPAGWLKDQLRVQASGLSGHLDEIWPDIKESAWTGGKAEGWERAPYWLDGLVPLAFELDDARLQGKVKTFIDYVLDHQQADGWLGPVSDGKHPPYDPWPLYVMFKALTQYHEATADERIIPALLRCARKIDAVISQKPLTSWAHFRSADFALSLYWLHERTKEPWLLDLADKVQRQGFDWAALYANFPFQNRVSEKFDLSNHGVNTGMGLKQPSVRYRLTGQASDRDAIIHMLGLLDKYHGQATGIFTCDEHLAGRNPSQGTELCTVVEAMFSLETAFSILGDTRLGDRLERITFNALPATFKPDMCAHQYDQQANQVLCRLSPDHVYVNNGPDANLFGLEPNFGCCTANMHQGWPKFISHLWMKSPDGGLVALSLAPCEVNTKVAGKPVHVSVATEYPFRETITISVNAPNGARLPLHLRIPAWAEGATVQVGNEAAQDAKAGAISLIDRTWQGPTQVKVKLPMRVRLWEGERNTVAIERGPLVYALKVEGYWKLLKGKPPFADWEVYPTTPWNFALKLDRQHPESSVRFELKPVGTPPFSPETAAVVAHVSGRAVPWWVLERNAAAPPPASPVQSDQPLVDLVLIPYGCTSLRVTEFPTLAEP